MTNNQLQTSVQYVKGVGPKVAKLFNKLGVFTIEDLIYFFPRDYEDRTQMKPIGKLFPSVFEIIKGTIISIEQQTTRSRFSVLKLYLEDSTGSIQAVWFNQPYLTTLFRRGMKLIVSGKVEYSAFDGTLQIAVRDFEIDTGENLKIVPRYSLTEGLYPKKVRSVVKLALDSYLNLVEDIIPEEVRKTHKLANLKKAIETLHYPDDLKKVEVARHRLVFDDFFVFQLGLAERRAGVQKEEGISFKVDQEMLSSFLATLPFQLTVAQHRVLSEILTDMQTSHPMHRLLQGDVGSGKTIVALIATLVAIANGYQAVIMVPTEILAQQHYLKILKMLKGKNLKVTLHTGSTSLKGEGRKNILLAGDLFIGTHALIEEDVQFKKLGLAVIDEQQRFGVLQRSRLMQKGVQPDVLIMTATPIPRSLALSLYGDLDRSVINELPPGRVAVETHFVPEGKRKSSYGFIRKKIAEGRQVYVVCPLVEESEKSDLKAAMEEAKNLQIKIFPEMKVGLIHGRMSGEEKEVVMRRFSSGEINILVSTTVIEVGIDIANATVMVIEHAERFGLSQLHQLRGRIGRGAEKSYCFLLANPKSDEAKERIKAMVESSDGFHIAEVDLKLRGPGEVCGIRQSGLPHFRVADLVRDEKLLKIAREAAFQYLEQDPSLNENPKLLAALKGRYGKFLGY